MCQQLSARYLSNEAKRNYVVRGIDFFKLPSSLLLDMNEFKDDETALHLHLQLLYVVCFLLIADRPCILMPYETNRCFLRRISQLLAVLFR
jgi:hypothetical protein